MEEIEEKARREQLLAERCAVVARARLIGDEFAAIVEAVAGSNADDEHDPEGATLGFERAQAAALLQQTAGRLAAVDGALARLDAGTYTTCTACGGPIDPDRLAALPATDRCIACAAQARSAGGAPGSGEERGDAPGFVSVSAPAIDVGVTYHVRRTTDRPGEDPMDQLDAHQRAQDALIAVLGAVGDDQLDDPTPCAEWTVRDLLAHVVAGNHRVAGSAAPAPEELARLDAAGLRAAVVASATAAQERFAAPDGLTRMLPMPFGEVPGSVVIGLRTTDLLTHAWDLAAATGQPTDMEPELAEQLLALSRERIQPAFRGPGKPFAEEQPCDDGLPAADRLAAFLGRSVGAVR